MHVEIQAFDQLGSLLSVDFGLYINPGKLCQIFHQTLGRYLQARIIQSKCDIFRAHASVSGQKCQRCIEALQFRQNHAGERSESRDIGRCQNNIKLGIGFGQHGAGAAFET